MDPARYVVFRKPLLAARVPRELPAEYRFAYVGVVALWRGGQREAARALIGWRVICLCSGFVGWPRVLAVYDGARIAHRSFMLPRIGRIPGMGARDLEIGSCWTEPEFRCQRLFQIAIQRICADASRADRTFWMVCRAANRPSVSGILASGLEQVGEAEHTLGSWKLRHHYVMHDTMHDTRVAPSAREIVAVIGSVRTSGSQSGA